MQTAFRSQLELRQKGNFMKARKKHPTTEPVKVKKADATAVKDEAMKLYERYMDYTLMDALAGEFHLEHDVQAKAAFAVHDMDALNGLCQEHACKIDFIEPDEILPGACMKLPKIELQDGRKMRRKPENLTTAERYEILRKHDGTRAYARVLLDAQGGGTPFDD